MSLFDFSIFQEKRRLERGPTPEEECGRPDELDRWDIKKKKIEHLEAVDVIFLVIKIFSYSGLLVYWVHFIEVIQYVCL